MNPDSLEEVTETAFENCDSIKKLFRFSNFRKCKSLTKVKIHHKTEHISSYLFYGCISLKDITIPDSVKYIEDNAF